MRKMINSLVICALIPAFIWGILLISDRQKLNDELIRLHVVANSDSAEDQAIKLQVRDAVITGIQEDLQHVANMEEAKAYLQENLPKIQQIANKTLSSVGFDGEAVVTLCKETFDTRYYDTFSLPAGVYESLRIIIGEGEGKNWWCVAFPALCLPATAEGFEDTAVGSGFSERLSETLAGEEKYEIRFFLLDVMGSVENIFFEG